MLILSATLRGGVGYVAEPFSQCSILQGDIDRSLPQFIIFLEKRMERFVGGNVPICVA
jgi:hypothetical protein